jgi:outer membrane lipoprotein-sorting protein
MNHWDFQINVMVTKQNWLPVPTPYKFSGGVTIQSEYNGNSINPQFPVLIYSFI